MTPSFFSGGELKDWIKFQDRMDKLRKAGCLIEAEPYAKVSILPKLYNWEDEDSNDQDAL